MYLFIIYLIVYSVFLEDSLFLCCCDVILLTAPPTHYSQTSLYYVTLYYYCYFPPFHISYANESNMAVNEKQLLHSVSILKEVGIVPVGYEGEKLWASAVDGTVNSVITLA